MDTYTARSRLGLEQYMIPGLQMDWLEAYRASLIDHIDAVRDAGARLNVPRAQLAAHDQSKWSVDEFPHYARQFHGDAGDPDAFAAAWLHHIHHNPHHWQHWIIPDHESPRGSTVDGGALAMPDPYVDEMIADWIGASICYTGSADMGPWLQKNLPRMILHRQTIERLRQRLEELRYGVLLREMNFGREVSA